MKLLSILIPTYHYPEGVRKILRALSNASRDQVEIIIGDDSIDDEVSISISEFNFNYPGLVSYIKNSPSLGAVKNWNMLLNKATGKYILLMHHDEFPISESWMASTLAKLGSSNSPEIILMPCFLFDEINSRIRLHLPRFIQTFVVNFFPSYLFRRNVIGSASCLIIRRDLYPKFDENLRWLVDVDMYWRLLSARKNLVIEPDLQIASISNRQSSITQSMASELHEVLISELDYLNQKYPNSSVWLVPKLHRTLFMGETILWGAFKSTYLLYCGILGLLKK
jgi:glycosyltransferase involved in cell wall biosynthesis